MSLSVRLNKAVYSGNITHNLGRMARKVEVGRYTLYEYLWRPDEISIWTAEELIEPLTVGLLELETHPERYKFFNPENEWGDYVDLMNFTREYLKKCILFPETYIEISR